MFLVPFFLRFFRGHTEGWVLREKNKFSLIFVDFHRFSEIFVGVFKIAEKHEKHIYTFFAFLPAYIGVSGSFVSRKR